MAIGLSKVVRNSGYLLGAQGINTAARAVYVVALAVHLGPAGYGIYYHGLAWYLTLLPVTTLGMHVILAREIGRRPDLGATLVVHTFTLRLAVVLAASAVLLLAARGIEPDPSRRVVLYLFSSALAARSLALWAQGAFVAYEDAGSWLRLHGGFRVAEVVLGVAWLGLGADVHDVALLHGVLWWMQALACLRVVHRRLAPVALSWDPAAFRRLARDGVLLASWAGPVAWYLQGPIILFRHAGPGSEALGQLALAFQVLTLASVPPQVVGNAVLPALSRAAGGADLAYVRAMLRLGVGYGTLLGVVALTVLPPAVTALFGDRYRASADLMGVALWLVIPFWIGAVTSQALLARDRAATALAAALSGSVPMTLTVIPLSDAFGVHGAVAAVGLGMGIWAVACLYALGASSSPLRPGVLLVPCAYAGIAAAATILLRTASPGAALAAGMIVVVVSAVWGGVLARDERAILLRWLRALWRRDRP